MTYIYNYFIRTIMKNKLTLRLDDSLIKEAKKYADEKGTSVSQLVADYFALLQSDNPSLTDKEKLSPITASLSGILKDSDVKEEDYKSHLEDKYLK